ncbi:hypothetical protein BH23DEI1_BH23DEI1_20250 [soil metagenome]
MRADDEREQTSTSTSVAQEERVAADTPHAHGGDLRGDEPTAVVAIGASAGGLGALRQLLGGMPGDAGLAVVVVVHLSPDHESHLVHLLQPLSTMPVRQISETTTLERDHVYVIPPGANVSSVDSHLRLSKLEHDRRDRAPIDHFFRTLSQTHDGHSIGVVLTGTGSDGALGLRRIKERGGLTIAQDPSEAEYDGMPQAAISTGMVDLILTLDAIPNAIASYVATEPQIVGDDGDGDTATKEATLQALFALIRSRTGRDFSRYKRSTLLRRIARRMQIHRSERLEEYLDYLRRHPAEVEALADECLVSVTEFFRDAAVFAELERSVVPKLFEGKGSEDSVRVWSVGCSTGEEAYSVAILLLEHAATLDEPPAVQVFATDLHEPSLRRAREGTYPETIESIVPQERLRRYFTKERGAYRIRKEVRDAIVFTSHNVLSDAPFSRLDLLLCRNLLIYLDRGVQRDVVNLFLYALLPRGYLLLGSAESLDRDDAFATVHIGYALFQKRGDAVKPAVPVFPLAPRLLHPTPEPARTRRLTGFADVHSELLDRLGPPSVMIDDDDSVLHLSARAGEYLRHPGGGLTNDVLKLVREEFRLELRSALHVVRSEGHPMRTAKVHFERHGTEHTAVIDVRPADDAHHKGVILLLFEEGDPTDGDVVTFANATSNGEPYDLHVTALERELQLTRGRLQHVLENAESTNEEMRASNEELQSMNEELRSAMEEFETSKEELQSVNEELLTVNEENQHKVEELAQMSSDLQTLMSATEIATLFLDRELRILRFTPRVGTVFNVRHRDRGRAIGDLTHRFGSHDLMGDAARVLERLVPTERELVTDTGEYFLTRVHPYRSSDDRIEGVVITFVDITQHKEAERRVREVNTKLEQIVAERTTQLRHANEELEAFNQSVSHDLRAPLRGIERFTTATLAKYGDALEEDGRDLLHLVVSGAKRMTEQIDGLLDLSRVGRGEFRWERVDLAEIAEQVVRELRAREPERRADVVIAPVLVAYGDERLLRIVVSNLLENAWKFTRGEDATRIEVGEQLVGGERAFIVRDNGAGFDPRGAHRLFVPFQRLHDPDSFEGSGIGLALVHRIITRHGGTMGAEGEVGAGSTFTFTLPPAPTDAAN